MEFDEMQAIWKSQREKPKGDVDVERLHERVRQRSEKLALSVVVEEFAMTLICLVVAAYQAWEPFFEGTDRYQYIGAALLVGVAAYMQYGRSRRLRAERAFDSSVRGELERAIYRVDYHIWRSRTFLWWFLAPSAVIVLMSFAENHDSDPPWKWVLVAFSFVLAYAVTQIGMRRGHFPVKRDLEALREELCNES